MPLLNSASRDILLWPPGDARGHRALVLCGTARPLFHQGPHFGHGRLVGEPVACFGKQRLSPART